jgi:hypothetical protein
MVSSANRESQLVLPIFKVFWYKTAVESPWNSMVALKKRVGRLSCSVIRLYPAADEIARF